jgi:hypothetical protein
MTFLAPLGLLALLTLPVIVLLHLRRERLRRVMVPSLLLWQHLAVPSGEQQKFRLPVTLLLLLHLLVAALLALALAHPQWLANLLGTTREHVVVVLDSSTSMATQENLGATRMDAARSHVRGLIEQLGPDDRLSLIEAGPQARLLASGNLNNQGGLHSALDAIEASGTGTDIASALTLAHSTYEGRPAGNERIVVISDLDPPANAVLPLDRLDWIRVGSPISNRALVELAASPRPAADGLYDVFARVANYEDAPSFTAVRLFADDELLDTRMVELPPNGEIELTWEIPGSPQMVRAELDTSDALPADNSASLSLSTNRTINALLVADAPDVLARALGAVPGLSLTTISPAEYSGPPADVDLLVFASYLPDSWPRGSVLVVNPPAGEHPLLNVVAAPASDEAAAAPAAAPTAPTGDDPFAEGPALIDPRAPAAAATTEQSSAMVEGLSLGGVDFGPLPQVQPPDWARVELMAGGVPLVLRGRSGESELAIWAFDPAQGNLATKLAFPLLTARTVRDLMPPTPPHSALVGQPISWQPNPRSDTLEIRAPDGSSRQLVISDTLVIEGLEQTGMYELIEYSAGEPTFRSSLAVNAGTPLESDLRPRPLLSTAAPYIPGATSAAEAESTPSSEPQPAWPWLAFGALLVLLVEWFYVHWR